jgi:hypothetical protein
MKDPIIHKLEREGLPVNRANYLKFAYFGQVPEKLDAEQEAQLPEQFQFKGDKDENNE